MRSIVVLCLSVMTMISVPLSAIGEEWDASIDFRFMELQRQLRENPESPEARPCLFAIGEYYFHQKNPAAATVYFRRFLSKTSHNVEDLLATVFLLRCAQELPDLKSALALEKELQETLSTRRFLALFNAAHFQSWTSPLGNRFDLREEVDTMEIMSNGKYFYTIKLS